MIDTIVEALHANGIYEIYVVVGYLKEQFHEWARSYDGVKLIENPWYNECNNISSLYSAREHLKNAIVLDGAAENLRRTGTVAVYQHCHRFGKGICPVTLVFFAVSILIFCVDDQSFR